MRVLDRFRHFWRVVVLRRRADRELDEELGQWADELTHRHHERGAAPVEARRRALAELGGLDTLKQTVQDERVGASWRGLPSDVRYAWRVLRRTPMFTAAAVLTLAIGLAATTAIFSAVNALLIEPLPFRDASRLVFIWSDMTDAGYPRAPLSGPEVKDLRERGTLFDGVGAIWATTTTLTGENDPEQLRIGLVTTNFFNVLGADAAIGRTFGDQDEAPGPSSILLSWPVFERRYGGDRSIVGRTIQVNGQPQMVIGVMPREFRLMLPADSSVPDGLQAWTPVRSAALARAPRGQQYLRVVARMKPRVTVDEARAQVTSIAAAISREFAEYGAAGRQLTTVALQADSVREIRPSLLVLFAGVGVLALIACVNVANLLVARAAERRREAALRAALGASASRLVREALAEGALIAALGAVCGVVVGRGLLAALLALRPAGLDRLAVAHVDWRVLLFACAVAAVGGVIFSLAPLRDLLRANLTALFENSDRRVGGQSAIRLRGGLILSQIALGVILVIGAGLLVRTFLAMQRVDPGFDTDHRLTFRLSVPFARYRTPTAINDFAQRLNTSLAAIPGVTGVGGISHLPYDDLPNWGGPYLTSPGQDESRAADADYRTATPGLFSAIDARFVEGRAFTDADDLTAAPVVIVDDILASRGWPGQSAVGRTIKIDPASSGHATTAATVVGVVHHMRLRSVVEDLTEQVFIPERQVLRNPLAYVVRTSGDPVALADQVRQTVHALDPLLPIYDVRTLDSYAADARGRSRFTATLALGMAAIALLLAAIGIYGIVAYGVARRRGEFGLRMALGARPAQVVRLALRDGAVIASTGVIVGVAGGLLVARLLRSQLYGVSPFDPLTFVTASLTLGLAVIAACYVPARRAARVNPGDALRS